MNPRFVRFSQYQRIGKHWALNHNDLPLLFCFAWLLREKKFESKNRVSILCRRHRRCSMPMVSWLPVFFCSLFLGSLFVFQYNKSHCNRIELHCVSFMVLLMWRCPHFAKCCLSTGAGEWNAASSTESILIKCYLPVQQFYEHNAQLNSRSHEWRIMEREKCAAKVGYHCSLKQTNKIETFSILIASWVRLRMGSNAESTYWLIEFKRLSTCRMSTPAQVLSQASKNVLLTPQQQNTRVFSQKKSKCQLHRLDRTIYGVIEIQICGKQVWAKDT